jgi:hypothetical protein
MVILQGLSTLWNEYNMPQSRTLRTPLLHWSGHFDHLPQQFQKVTPVNPAFSEQ